MMSFRGSSTLIDQGYAGASDWMERSRLAGRRAATGPPRRPGCRTESNARWCGRRWCAVAEDGSSAAGTVVCSCGPAGSRLDWTRVAGADGTAKRRSRTIAWKGARRKTSARGSGSTRSLPPPPRRARFREQRGLASFRNRDGSRGQGGKSFTVEDLPTPNKPALPPQPGSPCPIRPRDCRGGRQAAVRRRAAVVFRDCGRDRGRCSAESTGASIRPA